ncbi:hypothetical protein ABL78_4374 [Leptomonas seymouri]|uniref:Uncharacterized protein n=1 Tax=Leptomonas seymouri TaxID=5684 RepID=A0A0N1PC67_LEPSE|nr:hypothetical protein ABL78_4374 [Leptomonas seymouri]|eukprot:KPI86551.1 hypothetical protein ABL78_4374 [Leptomonas seymouri]
MPLTSSRSRRDASTSSLRAFNDGDGGTAATTLTRLEAYVAVRLDPLLGKTFDCYGLPLRRSREDQRCHFSFIKSVKGLASYLTTRINPSFQECLIRVVETESDMRFEVRQISNGKGTRARLLFSASLSTLVDVARHSVIEKDTVVFSQLPSTFQPIDKSVNKPAANSGAMAESHRSGTTSTTGTHHNSQRPPQQHKRNKDSHNSHGAASKKEELISTLFSAYGDIGLNLVFHATRAEEDRFTHHDHRHHRSSSSHGGGSSGSSHARPYTRIGLRFVSTVERNEWLSFCGEAYMGLLLDSIRINRDTVYIPDSNNGDCAAATSASIGPDAFHLEKPSEEAVENYIDFFLSARTKTDGKSNNNNNGSRTEADPLLVPFSGVLRIRSVDGSLHTREVHLEKDDGVDDAGTLVTRSYLVFRLKRRFGKGETQRIPLEGLQVYADDDQVGTSFFLECASSAKSAAELVAPSRADRSLTAHQLYTLHAVQQSFLCGTELTGSQHTVTLECEAGSFAARRQWLQWLEMALKKPVVYLSVARRNVVAQKPVEQDTHNGLLGDRVVW